MSAPPQLIGARLGAYEIQGLLGSGGMANVYRGFDTNLHRAVAIKVLSPAAAAEPGFVDRFRQEARLIANLRHPNIVQVYDFGQQDSAIYMVQELLAGPTLEAWIGDLAAHGMRPSPAEIIQIITQLADALDAAHAAGIIHRDVKPANALWNDQSRLVLTDFGIAKQLISGTNQTQLGMIFGTPSYLSPEQAHVPRYYTHARGDRSYPDTATATAAAARSGARGRDGGAACVGKGSCGALRQRGRAGQRARPRLGRYASTAAAACTCRNPQPGDSRLATVDASEIAGIHPGAARASHRRPANAATCCATTDGARSIPAVTATIGWFAFPPGGARRTAGYAAAGGRRPCDARWCQNCRYRRACRDDGSSGRRRHDRGRASPTITAQPHDAQRLDRCVCLPPRADRGGRGGWPGRRAPRRTTRGAEQRPAGARGGRHADGGATLLGDATDVVSWDTRWYNRCWLDGRGHEAHTSARQDSGPDVATFGAV